MALALGLDLALAFISMRAWWEMGLVFVVQPRAANAMVAIGGTVGLMSVDGDAGEVSVDDDVDEVVDEDAG